MKKQKTMVLFAIALLLGVVALAGSAQAMSNTEYLNAIEQPVDAGKVRFILSAVDGDWVKGTKCTGLPMEIMYWDKDTKYAIHIDLDGTGNVLGNVSFYRWGIGRTTIPDWLATQSLAKLPKMTAMGRITEAKYKEMVNEWGPVDLSKINYEGNAVHKEWVKGSTPKSTYNMGTGAWEAGPETKNSGTLIYWNKYSKWVITLKLDGEGYVEFVDFGLNGNRAVNVIPLSLYEESISKLWVTLEP